MLVQIRECVWKKKSQTPVGVKSIKFSSHGFPGKTLHSAPYVNAAINKVARLPEIY
jgi:hypothetical protein